MNRVKLIKKIFAKNNFKTYFEIGTEGGGSFFPIWAKNKIAVPPKFTIRKGKRFRWLIKNPHNFFNHYFEMTSDRFFAEHAQLLKDCGGVDVALVDGLHTFRAALQDTLNVLQYLNPDGVVVLHDCLPPSKAAAMPTKTFPTKEEQNIPGWNGTWCGDVWKAIVYLKKVHGEQLDVCVLDTDLGLGIVRLLGGNGLPSHIDENVASEIDQLTFDDLQKDVDRMLNLKPVSEVVSLLDLH